MKRPSPDERRRLRTVSLPLVALAAGQTHGSGCRSQHEAGDLARVTSVEFRLVA